MRAFFLRWHSIESGPMATTARILKNLQARDAASLPGGKALARRQAV
jgi:hypothetical protein